MKLPIASARVIILPSPPPTGAWIETRIEIYTAARPLVAPSHGGVD